MIENQQFYLLLLSNSFIQEHKEQASTPRFLLIKSYKAISLSECHRSQDKSACKLQIIFAGQDHTCSQTPFSNQKYNLIIWTAGLVTSQSFLNLNKRRRELLIKRSLDLDWCQSQWSNIPYMLQRACNSIEFEGNVV